MSVRFRKIKTLVDRMVVVVMGLVGHQSVRFQKVNTLLHRMADWLCWLDEEPHQESVVVRKLRPLTLRLLWAILTYR